MAPTMKAIVLHNEKEDERFVVSYDDVPLPTVSEGEALVKLSAAALNHRDEFIRMKLYPAIQFGSVLGADGTGTVEAVGSPQHKSWVGKQVLIDSAFNWGDDEQTHTDAFGILGMLPFPGTFAEYIVVPVRNLYEKPAHLSWEEAAATPLAGLTAWRATITKAQVKKGQNVLITGIGGGVALFALQFAVAVGANVYVTSSSDEKIARAKALGAKGGVNYKKPTWAKDLNQLLDGPLDSVVDGAGGESLNNYIKLLKRGGIISIYGATVGLCDNLNITVLFLKNIEIRGTSMGSPREFAAMIELINHTKLRPIVDSTRPISKAKEAFELMRYGNQFGKIVLTISDNSSKM